MDFLAILNDTYARLQVADAQSGTFGTRIKRYVNRWHRKILSEPGFEIYRKTQVTQATVADQWRYGTPLKEIDFITERTNDVRLVKRSESWWRQHYPDPTEDTGDPEYWIPLGTTRIQNRPANASELFVISTSAADTSQTARVEAVLETGETVQLSVTMTGTTGVTLSATTTNVVDVISFSISAVAAGTVTLREDSGTGDVLSTIVINETSPKYTAFALAPTPSSAITLYLDGTARIFDFANSDEEPLFDEDYHDILVDGAVHDEWQAKGRKAEAERLRDEIQLRIQQLRTRAMRQTLGQDETMAHPRDPERMYALPLS